MKMILSKNAGLLTFMVTDKFIGNTFGFSPLSFVIVSNVIMNGIVLGCIGLVALYIGHIHTEVIGRPLFLVRRRIGKNVFSSSEESSSSHR